MTPINIPFKGIDRSTSDILAENGTMEELINLRLVNGSLQPIGECPTLKDSEGNDLDISGYQKVLFHKTPSISHFLVLKEGKIYFLNDGKEETVENLPSDIYIPEDVSLSYITNVIEATYIEDGAIQQFYLYWDGVKYVYLNFGILPPLVRIEKVDYNRGFSVIRENFDYDGGNLNTLLLEKLSSKVNEIASESFKKSMICGSFTWMYAVRMFDGTYKMTSPLMLSSHTDSPNRTYKAEIGNENEASFGDSYSTDFFTSLRANDLPSGRTSGKYFLRGSINPHDITFRLEGIENIVRLKDFIISVDVFMSMPIIPVNTNKEYEKIENKTFPFFKTSRELAKEYEEKATLFKVASFDIDNLETEIKLDDVDFNNLAVREAWESDFDPYNKITSNVSYVYNNKLHKADIVNQLGVVYPFKRHQAYPISSRDGEGNISIGSPQSIARLDILGDNPIFYTRVKLNTANGVSTVVVESKDYLADDGVSLNRISGLLCYPDNRAFSLEFIIIGKGGKYYHRTSLKAHPFFNLAYSLTSDFRDTQLLPFQGSFTDLLSFNIVENRPNVLKVSETDNMLTFMNEKTYRVGSAKIIGLCSNTQAISTGQFGEFPLCAFCTDGIYALGLGTGEVDYSSIKPVARDVCNNPKSITPIDNAVVFSSNRGLLMIAGNEIAEFSSQIEGKPFDIYSGVSQIPLLQKAITHDKLVQLKDALSVVNFKEYIKEASIAYVYNENREIIVSNPNYNYSYRYSLDINSWLKSDIKIDSFIGDYPFVYADIDGKMYDLTKEEEKGSKQTMFLTRPIKTQGQKYHRLLQAVMRSYIHPVQYSGFYVFGSVDGTLYRFIGGTEYMGGQTLKEFQNIGCLGSREKMRYLRIAYVGHVEQGTKLDYLELSIDYVKDRSV